MDRLTRISSVLLLLAAACGGGNQQVQSSKGSVVAEVNELDFGAVFIGDRGVVHVRVQNRSRYSGPISVDIVGPFRLVPGDSMDLGPSQVATVELEYKPTDEKPVTGTATISISGVEEKAVVSLKGEGSQRAVQAVPALDVGTLDLGSSKTVELEVKSLAKLPLVVSASVSGDEAFAFVLGARQLAIPASGTAKLPITFTARTEQQHRTTLELKPCPEGQACDTFKVSLTGSGTKREIKLSTDEVAFGDVPVGDSGRKTVTLTNSGSVPVWVSTLQLQDGPGSPFKLETSTALPTSLAEDGHLDITVDFVPTAEIDYQAVIKIEAGGKVLELPVTGNGGSGDLIIDPLVIDFGVVPTGVPRSATVTLRDVGVDTPVKIIGIRVDNDPASAYLVTFPFSLPATARTEQRNVEVTFNGPAEGVFEAELTISPEVGSNRHVVLRGEAVAGSWCDLDVSPAALRFGMVKVGKTATRKVTVRNKVATACSVSDFHVTGSEAFRVSGLPAGRQTIAGKGTLAFDVTYQPSRTSIVPEQATLAFQQTTQEAQDRTVPLTGVGTEADLQLSPAAVDFGTHITFTETLRSVDVLNAGARPVEVVGWALTQGVSDVGILSRSTSGDLAPGAQRTVQLEFRPRSAATVNAELMIWLAGAVEPFIVPLTGTGETKTCTAACDQPVVSCPADQNGFLQRGFELVGAGKDRSQGVSCTWEVVSAPQGSAALPAFDGDCTHPATFQADVAGTYDVKLTATDPDNNPASCQFTVNAPVFEGLWIETRWDQVDDVDVHLFLPDAGRIDRASVWRTGNYEVWENAPRPSWGQPGLSDDPVLERGSGMGPEIVRIDQPAAGSRFELGVHWPTTAYGHATLAVDTTIWCGGSPVASSPVTFDAPYIAVDLGTIEMTSASTCTFTPGGSSLTVLP